LPNSSNVKFPLVTIAALQYHARSYPVLIDSQTPVHCRVIGSDLDSSKEKRAERVSQHMSYQILEEDENWEAEMDRVLIKQPIIGCAFKKCYFDPILGHNVSENIFANNFVVNYWTKHLDTAPRIIQIQYFSKNDIYERVARGLFLEMVDDNPAQVPQGSLSLAQNKAQGMTVPDSIDDSTPYEILEQHRYIDFDGDGKAEYRRVLKSGSTILINEEFDYCPIEALTPVRMPHKHVGMSKADQVMDIQLIRSTLLRQMLNNLYLTNNPEKAVL